MMSNKDRESYTVLVVENHPQCRIEAMGYTKRAAWEVAQELAARGKHTLSFASRQRGAEWTPSCALAWHNQNDIPVIFHLGFIVTKSASACLLPLQNICDKVTYALEWGASIQERRRHCEPTACPPPPRDVYGFCMGVQKGVCYHAPI
jgi:hypothetical protein